MLGLLSGGIPWKLIGGGILIAALSFFVWLHLSGDRAKDNKITELNGIIVQLEVDKSKLVSSNKSLEASIKKQKSETEMIVSEFTNLKKVDDKLQSDFENFKKVRENKNRKYRIEALIRGRMSSLLLYNANKQASCQWEHYDDFKGKCVAGKWK